MLSVSGLTIQFGDREPVVRNLSFEVEEGQRLGIIGQSGSGKSVTALAIMGLLPEYARVSGSIRYRETELIGLPEKQLKRLRGNELSMVFQEPMTALDPTMKVGRQLGEVVALHQQDRRGTIRADVLHWFERVGLEDPARVANSYPHELSGGQRQRALISLALANEPSLVICDEPTTALDVLVQRQILNLLATELQDRGSIFVTHDLAVVREIAEKVLVMKDGEIIESGEVGELISNPSHAYTRQLIADSRLERVQQPLADQESRPDGIG